MAACQEVRTWLTKNILSPVTKFLTAAREVCEELKQRIEEKVSQPIEQNISRQERKCRKLPWWNPLRWFCAILIIVEKIIVWVLVTVIKWVAVLVCQIVTIVIGAIVTFVLRVISWLVTFFVCLFTDFAEAWKSFRDLWTIITDLIDDVFDLVITLLNDISGILTDIEHLLDTLSTSLGWLGVVLGILRGVISLIRNIVDLVKDAVEGLKEVVLGILGLNLCRMLRGITDIGTSIGRAILDTGFAALIILFAIWFPPIAFAAAVLLIIRVIGAMGGGVRDSVKLHSLEDVITKAINDAFGADSERADRSLDKVGLGGSPMGLPFKIDARRLFFSSDSQDVNLKELHDSGALDLYSLAGYLSSCKDLLNGPSGEVVYAGTDLRVSYADLETFLNDGPGSVPEFHAFPITRAKFRAHLEAMRRKAFQIGIQAFFPVIGSIRGTSTDHVPLNVSESSDAVQQALFQSMGRNGQTDDLSTIPTISIFNYVDSSLYGLTTWFRPGCGETGFSGVTYRNRTPDWVFRWVLPHELGHYWGLNHKWNGASDHCNQDGISRSLEEVMYKPNKEDLNISGSAVLEYLFLGGEPHFIENDAEITWKWITTEVEDSLLP